MTNDSTNSELTAITSGDTVEEWVESFKHDYDLYDSVKRYTRSHMKYDLEFENMKSVSGFLERFHCADFTMQKKILWMLQSENCYYKSLTFLKLLQDTDSVYSEHVAWSSIRIEKDADQLFQHLNSRIIGATKLRLSYTDAWIVQLLATTYGENRVCEVIQEWTDKKLTNSFCDFAPLVEQWDTVKEYSLDWAVNVTNTHTCLTVHRDFDELKQSMSKFDLNHKHHKREYFEEEYSLSSYEEKELY